MKKPFPIIPFSNPTRLNTYASMCRTKMTAIAQQQFVALSAVML